jgi:hypothetical protein
MALDKLKIPAPAEQDLPEPMIRHPFPQLISIQKPVS